MTHRHCDRRTALRAAAAATMLAAGLPLRAQGNSPLIRFVVPFAAGSYTDNVARIIAPAMSDKLGQTIVIDNRAGANGLIGADAVAKAAPDGLTVLVGGASVNTVNPSLFKSLPYDPVRDLLPVSRIGLLPFMVVVNPQLPVRSIAELIAHAKANPDKLAYGTPNAVTLVGMETLKREAGVRITSVPYKSSPQAMTDLVAGTIQVAIADFATAMPLVQAGKLRMLAVTMRRRSPILPDVPPVADVIPGFDISAWTGLLLPGRTPATHAQRLHAALQDALAARELQDRLKGIGFEVSPMPPAEFGPYVQAEIRNWARLVKEAGVVPE